MCRRTFIQNPPDEGLLLWRQYLATQKTGRCALTNQRSPTYPLGTELSNYAQRNVPFALQRPRALPEEHNGGISVVISLEEMFVSALTGAGKSSTFELARIFRTTVSFLSAQFRHKMFVEGESSPLDISFPAINPKFKQVLVNFRLKSFFVITLVQSKQTWSFDRRRRNAHMFDYFGRSEWNWFFEIPVTSHARHSSFLARGAKKKTFNRLAKSTSRDFCRSLGCLAA